ncbi:MAG: beta-lactamase family protein [Rubrivivax sp.]|nr:beta-lactamase family protein [Rubrivivax sp.]
MQAPLHVHTQGFDEPSQRVLAHWLLTLAARRPLARATLAVERLADGARWTGATGAAQPDGTPMRPDTPWFIASIDKLLVAAVVLQLVAEGRLALPTRIATLLPGPLWRGLHVLDGVDRSEAITVQQLLGHGAGLADWLEDRPASGTDRRPLVEQVIAEGDREPTREAIAEHVRRHLRPHFVPQDMASPRRRIRYSDTHYLLLGAVVEAAAGQPLHEAVAERLLRPLGLTQTWFTGRMPPPPDLPAMAVLRADGEALALPRLLRSVHAVCSSAADQLALLRALVHDGPQELKAAWRAMQSGWRRLPMPRDRAALRAPGWPIDYASGLMRFALPRWLPPWRATPALVGHTGSTGCWLFHCPDLGLLLAGDVGEAGAGALPFRTLPRLLQALQALPVRQRAN